MRGIHLDQLLKEFLQNDFVGFMDNVVVDSSNVLATSVPVVELELGLDVNYLTNLIRKIPTDPTVRKNYPYEEFPRYADWEMKLLWAENYQTHILTDIYYKKVCEKTPHQSPDDTSKPIKDYLSLFQITIPYCVLSIFKPGGYLRPHRDIGLNPTPLNYFWLPINNPSGSSLKIYPYGNVDIKLGNMYLLNQENFVHSAVNFSNEDRIVLVGHIDNYTDQFKNLILQSIAKMYKNNLTYRS